MYKYSLICVDLFDNEILPSSSGCLAVICFQGHQGMFCEIVSPLTLIVSALCLVTHLPAGLGGTATKRMQLLLYTFIVHY